MPRRLILILIALFFSVGAVMLVTLLPRGPSHRAAPPPPPRPVTRVLVARANLPVGAFVQANDLVWQTWGEGALPADYVTSTTGRASDFYGAVVRVPLAAGDPVVAAHVVKPGERGFMAAVLQPGDRAMTININPATGDAGFIQPGDRVDLILTQTVQQNGVSRHVSETVMHGVKIVGLDQKFNSPDAADSKKPLDVPRTATLEVTPKQAEIVAVVNDMGVLSLALNSLAGQDVEEADASVTRTWDTEATHLPPPTPAAPSGAPAGATGPRLGGPVWTVQVVRGGQTSQSNFLIPRPRMSRFGAPPPDRTPSGGAS
ncbi:MAG: Flp pilus assembly protein CpaB [Alphaproteobacteria bacterium]|nr:Flp pilus assembly protein CpaB [Alphaproteobacteria bacterium]